jgi:hypothetical protein
MNKKAVLVSNVIYIAILVGAMALLGAFIYNQSNGASIWEDYYAKELTRIVNTAEPGENVTLDIHKATEIAGKNGISDYETTFEFHNQKNEICVRLSKNQKDCYSYFNDVDITEYKIIYGRPINLLTFEIKEKPILEANDE